MNNAEGCGNVYFIVLFSADRSSFDSIKSLVRSNEFQEAQYRLGPTFFLEHVVWTLSYQDCD